MAKFTNVTTALINMHDGATPLIPGVETDLDDALSNNPRFQELLSAGSIVAGPPPQQQTADPNAVETFYSANSAPDTVTGGAGNDTTGGGGAP